MFRSAVMIAILVGGFSPGQPPTPPDPKQKQLNERDRLQKEYQELYEQKKYAACVTVVEKMLRLDRAAHGEAHADVALSLEELARLHLTMKDYPTSIARFRELVQVQARLYGERDWRAINTRVEIADMEFVSTLSPERQKQHEEMLAWSNESLRLRGQGKSREALSLNLKAIERCRQLRGEENRNCARLIGAAAVLYRDLGDYSRAEPLALRAVELLAKVVGKEHPNYANQIVQLAALFERMGQLSKAEPLLRQARGIYEKLELTDLADYDATIMNLGLLYVSLADPERAEPLLRKGVELARKRHGTHHASYATALNNLGLMLKQSNRLPEAEPLYQEALEVTSKALGKRHPTYAVGLNNLAAVYSLQAKYDLAEPLYKEALDIRKAAFGDKHPNYATGLNNLARLYWLQGNFSEAERLYRETAQVLEAAVGELHPNHISSLNNLGSVFLASGRPKLAEPIYARSLALHERYAAETFAILSERQRLRLQGELRSTLDSYLNTIPPSEGAARYYSRVLAWKGAVLARQIEDRVVMDQPDLKPLVGQLNSTRAQLARMGLETPTAQSRDAWRARLAELRTQMEIIEGELAQKSLTYRKDRDQRRLTPEAVARCLPPDAAFVDFLQYTQFHPFPSGKGGLERKNHFLAFVIRPGQPVSAVELGDATLIDQAIQAWRDAIERGSRDLEFRAGLKLVERIGIPLQKHLAGVKRLFLCPDAALCGVPFDALPGGTVGTHFLKDQTVSYVTSGRHLVEIFTERPSHHGRGLLAVGGVRYDPTAPAATGVKAFSDLPGTEREARLAHRWFHERYPGEPGLFLTAAEPSESRVKKELSARWRYLHLATHGYFAPDAQVTSGVVFTRSEQDDGILSAEEVTGLDLRGTELVVLSACESGRGELVSGQGVLGLQRAFQAAGARSLILSQWPVDDRATALLMLRFYENLFGTTHPSAKKAMPKAMALREAKNWLRELPATEVDALVSRLPKIERGKERMRLVDTTTQPAVKPFAHPYYWSAFILIGDPE